MNSYFREITLFAKFQNSTEKTSYLDSLGLSKVWVLETESGMVSNWLRHLQPRPSGDMVKCKQKYKQTTVICTIILNTLFRNMRFMLDEMI